jgi:large subunit ribosomal protein L25
VIRALPDNLPDFFDVDISELKIGDNILVESLLNDDFTILHPDTTVVVQVKAARAALVIETEEEQDELEGVEGAEGEASEEGAETAAAKDASEGAKE